ncbi:MAG TPA: biotin carboxylase N-terminal domain-containing protein [Myxococcales bacterium]|nr:biotin carboxylase N-terminal domain-containing protein [Myxococcales bacterium]
MFRKVLIANRGEIAVRIAAVCRRMGVKTVAVYSEADAKLPHVAAADEAVAIGPPPPKDSYLKIDAILEAAKKTGAEAIHPGYGFLSENAEFASRTQAAGITFVGPPPEAMTRMKDKAQARQLAVGAGVPVVPGSDGTLEDPEAARAVGRRLGYPLLVKAANGGGGIGMQVAQDEAGLEKAMKSCADRAKSAFGRAAVYLERYYPLPRHIEVQVLGDGQKLLHFFERECSIQRRYQKVVEETPSPLFLAGAGDMPEKMYRAAIAAAQAFGYANAGTVEFLVAEGQFFFMEMNARLQVEHPITEATTGADLIGWQLRIASGEKLDLEQKDVHRSGHALEFRVYAEDPVRFFPSPGTLTAFEPPAGEGVRCDAGYRAGDTVTPYYDPLIAKLVVSGPSRAAAIDRAAAALAAFRIEGLKSNLELHRRIVASDAFRRGELDTHFLERLK